MPRFVAHIPVAMLVGVMMATVVCAGDLTRSAVQVPRADAITRVEAQDSNVADIVANLSRRFSFEVVGDVPRRDVKIARTIEGTLGEILAKLLKNTNYILVTEEGAPRRLVILPAGSTIAQPDRPVAPVQTTAPDRPMSVEQIRQKASEFSALSAQFEEMSEEALERANPEFAKKFKSYAESLSSQAKAMLARLPP